MHKVTAINLNGRAYQFEDHGYESLRAYMLQAEKALANDPDKADVLADIEQAIADKCDRALRPGKNVVSTEQITAILKEMGKVESGDGTNDEKEDEPSDSDNSQPKRLFVIRDGAMILGVCRGLGAYFGIDPTIVRLIFALLTLVTGGVWIVIYLLLALVLPEAKTESDLSEAYGKPVTAQAILERARERAPNQEMIKNLSDGLVKVLRIAAKIARVLFVMAIGLLTAAWLVALWTVVFNKVTFYDQLQVLNGWRTLLALTVAYLIAALPLLVLSRIANRIAENRTYSRAATATEGSLSALWGISWVILVVMGISYGQNFRDYSNTHQGNIDIGASHICVDDTLCSPNADLRNW